MDSKHTVSRRAQRVWDKLGDWYGSKWAEEFGPIPLRDWCELIDATDNNSMALALANIKTNHPNWPPTFPQFEQWVRKTQKPRQVIQSETQYRFIEFVLSNYSLTPNQVRMSWTWIAQKDPAEVAGLPFIGAAIPPDGDIPGFLVKLEEMSRGTLK